MPAKPHLDWVCARRASRHAVWWPAVLKSVHAMCVVHHFLASKTALFIHQKFASVVGVFGIFVVFFYVFVALG
jgi:hypothetical protein